MRRQNKCHYCWEAGHNIQTCPKAKAAAAADPNSLNYYSPSKIFRLRSETQCSFCKQSGHNVATCSAKKEQNASKLAEAKAFRKKFINWCKENSLGIGTMISIERTSYSPKKYGMVIGLQTNNIHHGAVYLDVFEIGFSDKTKGYCTIPYSLFNSGINSENSFEILSACGDFNKYWTYEFMNCLDLDPRNI